MVKRSASGPGTRGDVSTTCTIADGVVESVFAGNVSPAELERSFLAAIELARQSGVFLFFTDVAGLTGGHSAGDIFALIRMVETLQLPRTLREAIVFSPSSPFALAAPDVQFYEDAARNRGWNVRLFQDRESALEWLKG
jgi:hypothetical protein